MSSKTINFRDNPPPYEWCVGQSSAYTSPPPSALPVEEEECWDNGDFRPLHRERRRHPAGHGSMQVPSPNPSEISVGAFRCRQKTKSKKSTWHFEIKPGDKASYRIGRGWKIVITAGGVLFFPVLLLIASALIVGKLAVGHVIG